MDMTGCPNDLLDNDHSIYDHGLYYQPGQYTGFDRTFDGKFISMILKPWTQTFIGTQVPCIRFEDQAKADIKTMPTVTTVVQVETMHQLISELQINCNNHMQH